MPYSNYRILIDQETSSLTLISKQNFRLVSIN